MKFIFVDAENIGLKEVECINAHISDKVLVYSKNDSIKELCERKLFLNISSYPTGTNQADFYIIGHLSAVINTLEDTNTSFHLYSQDKSLVTAFSFQCDLYKVPCVIALPPKQLNTLDSELSSKPDTAEDKLYQIFKMEQTTAQAKTSLNLPQADFTRALNTLIKTNRIKKTSLAKKTWLSQP